MATGIEQSSCSEKYFIILFWKAKVEVVDYLNFGSDIK